ncbi:hypothetical protein EV421DRAFT_1146278 [Armillaria borealis]|uniref:NACHT domain-containing protein n=1 Tax=Armillaria borealis TaxID=47425 RepID=A0AA39J837_9AGAR|nr:hypothetical protein EV421DRAFT_1146278 [Armillaria borealis]
MAEALGITSSIVALVEVSWTIYRSLIDVGKVSKEYRSLSKELSGLAYWLSEVRLFTDTAQPNDPWLLTMQKLSGPVVQLTALLEDLQKELKFARTRHTMEKVIKPGTNKVKSRLLGITKELKRRVSWKFKKENVEDVLKKIERIKSLMIVAAQHDHLQVFSCAPMDGILDSTNQVEQVTGRVETNIIEIRDQVAHIKDDVSQQRIQMQKAQDEETLIRVLAWLTDLNFKSIQAEKLSQRVEDTGHWFLESELFEEWVNGPTPGSSCLWCPGNLGVGKTILAAIVIDYLRSLNHERKTLILSIFCDYQSATTQTIPNLLCSLLKQLVQDNGLSDPITLLYHRCLRDETRPTLDTLTKTLSEELKSFYCVYIVLDALDEFTDDKQEELINTTRLLGDNIHLLVTLREITKIGRLFEEDVRLDIQATDADITMFVADKLSQGDLATLSNGHDNLCEAILTGVTEKAKGMFLLASLHMDLLAQSTNQKILRDALKELPDNMMNAYDKTMERVSHQGKHTSALAINIFSWIMFVRCPLTLLELQHALAVELGTTTLDHDNLCSKDLLGSVCGGLVIMDQMGRYRDPIVRFVHYTTQEYFMSQKDILFPQFQETITRTCLTYLLFNHFGHPFYIDYDDGHDDNDITATIGDDDNTSDDDGSENNDYHYDISIPHDYGHIPDDLARKYPFLRYSLIHWGYHASELQYSMGNEIIAFLDSACCRKVTKILHATMLPREALIPLHFAVDYGLLHITKVLLDRGDDPCQCTIPLLVTAIVRENLEMVKLLLDQDKIDPNTKSYRSWPSPLSYAVEWGSTQIVEILLQSDRVDVNCKNIRGCTPLMLAVISDDISMVKVLLKHVGVDKYARDNEDNTAYGLASFRWWGLLPDSCRMITLLKKYGCRSQIIDCYEPTYWMASDLPNEQLNLNSGFRIPLDSSTTFPVENLTGPPPCHDTNGYPVYIGSAIFRRCILPCKIEPHLPVPCSVLFGGREITHMGCYNLLPFNPDTMEFVPVTDGCLPSGRKPIKGGYEANGSPLYHVVAVHNGIRIPGKVTHRWYVL